VTSASSSFFQGQTPDMHVHTESGTLRSESVEFSVCHMRGWRPAMEDAHIAEMLDASVFPDVGLFAVLDGHGGGQVSALAAQLLQKQVLAAASKQRPKSVEDWKPSLAEALSTALPTVDAQIRTGIFGLGRLQPGMLHPFCHEGSTACVVGVDFARQELVCANIGDSRGLLIRDGKAIALSVDHKPENNIERRRIESAGGRVVHRGCCYRIDGVLNVSRALGDYYMKATPSLPPEKQKISAFPDMTNNSYQSQKQELLVVACDGLFEKKQNQDIADFVWPRFRAGMALEKIGQDLLKACCAASAMSNGRLVPVEMGTDNETVIIVKLPVTKSPDNEGVTDADNGLRPTQSQRKS